MNSIHGSFIVDCDCDSATAIIACIGELDLSTAEAMTLAVHQLDPRTRSIIFDFRYVTFADAAGLGPIESAIELFGIGSVSIQEPSRMVEWILGVIQGRRPIRTDGWMR
jgi:anti-anti-sigma regulatory factor